MSHDEERASDKRGAGQERGKEGGREGGQRRAALTLLLRLAGPMQSWGTQSAFNRRDTGLDPSKSGVIGLLCAALGRPREAPVDDLAALQMGVRVDHEGVLQTDYHTTGGVSPAERARRTKEGERYGVAEFSGGGVRTVLSLRAYLADANFLVGLSAHTPAEQALLHQLDHALARPVWPLFLGRKAFLPAEPVRLPDLPPLGPGLRPLPLRAALLGYPWPTPAPAQPTTLRFVFDVFPHDDNDSEGVEMDDLGATAAGAIAGAEWRNDTPLSFTSADRRYAPRRVHTAFLERPATTSFSVPFSAELPGGRDRG